MNPQKKSGKNLTPFLWAAVGILALGALFARAVYPEYLWLTIGIAVLLVAALALLVKENHKALRTRSVAFGVNSMVTVVLVVAIVAVLNFLVSRYPKKLDLTQNKVHTLSDQTEKVVKGLKQDVKATLFAKFGQREELRPLLDNYSGLNPKFQVEFVDPDKEPTRAKQLGIRKYGTLHLSYGNREQQIEDFNEEKLTNALIKMSKDKAPMLCALTGHGEKSFTSQEADGYEGTRKMLVAQAYEIKDVSLLQEGKVPENCDALAIIGPSKPFIGNDLKILTDYFANGGRAIIALDLNLKGGEPVADLLGLLRSWHVEPVPALIVDPVSRAFGVDAAAPVIATFATDSPITKDFKGASAPSIFPFTRPLDISKDAPTGMVKWLAQSTPQSWGVVDLSKLAKGAVKLETNDRRGPLNVAVSVEGKQKDSKATRNTRLAVFGTSAFATNQYSRFGFNQDFFLNAVSWVLEDESMISIRAKEDAPSRVDMSQKEGTVIFLLTVIVMPLLIAVSGIVVWVWRRRL